MKDTYFFFSTLKQLQQPTGFEDPDTEKRVASMEEKFREVVGWREVIGPGEGTRLMPLGSCCPDTRAPA